MENFLKVVNRFGHGLTVGIERQPQTAHGERTLAFAPLISAGKAGSPEGVDRSNDLVRALAARPVMRVSGNSDGVRRLLARTIIFYAAAAFFSETGFEDSLLFFKSLSLTAECKKTIPLNGLYCVRIR